MEVMEHTWKLALHGLIFPALFLSKYPNPFEKCRAAEETVAVELAASAAAAVEGNLP